MKFYIPENLNLNELIYENRPSFKPFKSDKLRYILHLIQTIPQTRKEYLNKRYIPLNATLLQVVIKNYRDYLNYLENDLRIIESDHHYIVGEKSIGYSFVERYMTKPKIETIFDFSLRKNLKVKKNKNKLSLRRLNYLTKWFDGLEIDLEKVTLFLDKEYELKSANKELWSIDKKGKFILPIKQYNYSFISADKIHRKDFDMKRDNNVKRFHSNLTNMRSIVRNALTYKGEQLYSIDLKNSQPYLSVGLFNNGIYNIINNKYNYYNIMLGETLEALEIKGVGRYVDLVVNGEFYEFLGERLENELGFQYSDRSAVKRAVFQILFTDNRFIGQRRAKPKRIFKKLFPEVYEIFAEIKRKDKTLLPRLLQYVESKLFVDIIPQRISKELPEAPIFTIHDSVATTKEYLSRIEKIISEELENAMGHKPTLQIDVWDMKCFDEYLGKLVCCNKVVA